MKLRLSTVLVAAVAAGGLNIAVLAPAQAAATDPVTNLQVSQAQVGTAEKVSATWNPNDAATAYRMYITDQSDGSVDAGLPSTDNTTGESAFLTTDALAPGGTYYVVVQARQPSMGEIVKVQFTALTLDTEAPNGSYTLDRTSAYLQLDFSSGEPGEEADFKITQTGLSDNTTPAASITRTILPGDGSASTSWTSSNPFVLRYHAAGTFFPKVRLTDTFGNHQDVSLPTVTVREDRTPPRVHITVPAHPTKVASWHRIHGTATDTGTGVLEALAFVVQKRGHVWYAYDFRRHKWLKGYSTLSKTIRKSKADPAEMKVTASGTWQSPVLRGLRRGKLHVEAIAIDNGFNISKAPNVNAVLH